VVVVVVMMMMMVMVVVEVAYEAEGAVVRAAVKMEPLRLKGMMQDTSRVASSLGEVVPWLRQVLCSPDRKSQIDDRPARVQVPDHRTYRVRGTQQEAVRMAQPGQCRMILSAFECS
jgi:hypothetical protein